MIRQIRLIAYFLIGVLLAAVSVFSYAGDRYIAGTSQISLISQCEAIPLESYEKVLTACQTKDSCPANQNGGTCAGIASKVVGMYSGSNLVTSYYKSAQGTYSYCSDATPTWDGAKCVVKDPCASKSGQSVDDGTVGPDNVKLSMSFPARSDDNYVGQTFCSGGCMAAVDKEVGSAGLTVGGEYIGQFSAKFSGQGCPSGQSPATPKSTPALIPKNSPEYDCVSKGMGYGYVNDVVKCVPKTASKETQNTSSTTQRPDGTSSKETKTDNTVCTSGVCITTTTTITTEYNSSGTVTGTTTKTDTTTKPDPNSGLGSGGVKDGQQQGAECGVSGKPPCGVKVDETGVKTDVSDFDLSFMNKVGAAYDEVRAKLEEVTRPKVWGVSWNYTVPAGACTALQFGVKLHQFNLDICKPLGYIRDLWSYVMYVITGLYIWRSARDAMNVV